MSPPSTRLEALEFRGGGLGGQGAKRLAAAGLGGSAPAQQSARSGHWNLHGRGPATAHTTVARLLGSNSLRRWRGLQLDRGPVDSEYCEHHSPPPDPKVIVRCLRFPATLTRSRGVSTMGLAMTRLGRLPSSPTLGEAVRCPLLESDLEQWIRCCTCRFPPVARDDDIAHDVAAELGSSCWRSSTSTEARLQRAGGSEPSCATRRCMARWPDSETRRWTLPAARRARPRSGACRPASVRSLRSGRVYPRVDPPATGSDRRVAADVPRCGAAAGRRGSPASAPTSRPSAARSRRGRVPFEPDPHRLPLQLPRVRALWRVSALPTATTRTPCAPGSTDRSSTPASRGTASGSSGARRPAPCRSGRACYLPTGLPGAVYSPRRLPAPVLRHRPQVRQDKHRVMAVPRFQWRF